MTKFHEDPINSFHWKLLTVKQTNKQTNKRQVNHNLLSGGNTKVMTIIAEWKLKCKI